MFYLNPQSGSSLNLSRSGRFLSLMCRLRPKNYRFGCPTALFLNLNRLIGQPCLRLNRVSNTTKRWQTELGGLIAAIKPVKRTHLAKSINVSVQVFWHQILLFFSGVIVDGFRAVSGGRGVTLGLSKSQKKIWGLGHVIGPIRIWIYTVFLRQRSSETFSQRENRLKKGRRF